MLSIHYLFSLIELVEFSSTDMVVSINVDPVNQRLSHFLCNVIRFMLIFYNSL